MEQQHSSIYAAISAVMNDIDGFVQKRKSDGLSYSFASETDIIAATRDAMNKHGVVIIPSGVRDLRTESKTSAKGTPINHVIGWFTFTFAHGDHTHLAEALGEAMDSSDKACNKAMTAAYKYVLRQTFMIETGDAAAGQERAKRKTHTSVAVEAVDATAFKQKFAERVQQLGDDLPTSEERARLLASRMNHAYVNTPNTSDKTRFEVLSWLTDRTITSGLNLTRAEIGVLLDSILTTEGELSQRGKALLQEMLIVVRSGGAQSERPSLTLVWNDQRIADMWAKAEELGVTPNALFKAGKVKNAAEFFVAHDPTSAEFLIDSLAA